MQRPDLLTALNRVTSGARRLRHGLARSTSVRRAASRRLVAAIAALSLAAWSHHEARAAAALRSRWEATTEVLVATSDIEIGEALGTANTEVQLRPASHVPKGSLDHVPQHRRAVAALREGEVVLTERVGARRSAAHDVPDGRSAVSVAVDGPLPPLQKGDRVQLVSSATDWGDPEAEDPGGARPVRVVASDALVVDLTEADDGWEATATLTVAVDESEVTDVAGAALLGPVAVVLKASEDG